MPALIWKQKQKTSGEWGVTQSRFLCLIQRNNIFIRSRFKSLIHITILEGVFSYSSFKKDFQSLPSSTPCKGDVIFTFETQFQPKKLHWYFCILIYTKTLSPMFSSFHSGIKNCKNIQKYTRDECWELLSMFEFKFNTRSYTFDWIT